MQRRAKVLITAFACNPERGSEPGVGYFFVSEMAKYCDLTVITEEVENRAAIERMLEREEGQGGCAAVRFKFLPWPLLDGDGKRIDDAGPVSYYKQLKRWEARALVMARELISREPFDATHHLTMQGYREPGFLWQLPLPFIWGPTGGHAQMPWRYFGLLGARGWLQHGFRNLGNWAQTRFQRRVRSAALAASAVIVNTSNEKRVFARWYGVEAEVIPEFGAETMPVAVRQRAADGALRLVWSGVHISRKGLPLLLGALARLGAGRCIELHILGDGPETARWRKIAERQGVDTQCHWHGRVPRAEAMRVMGSSDAFVMTSLVDGTSCVMNEAIGLGLPVICHDACGFGDLVDASCGMLVPLSTPAGSVAGLAEAIRRLQEEPGLYERLVAGVFQRALGIQKEIRGRQMWEVYQRVLHIESDRAPVGMSDMAEQASCGAKAAKNCGS